ncbi:hypothetical protein [Methanosarcina mazei]|nr:hypothetical protein [Methanosarcina mazei]
MEPIITHEYEIEQAPEAYNIIKERKPYLGLVLKYDTDKRIEDKVILKSPKPFKNKRR